MMDRDDFKERMGRLLMDVYDDGGVERGRSFLPLSSDGDIQPAQSVMVKGRIQVPFRGDRLAVWSRCADDFLIESIRFGNMALGVSYGDIPADAFATRLDLLPMLDQQLDDKGMVVVKISKKAAECFGQPLAMPKMTTGMEIYVHVTNVGIVPKRFVAVVLGDETQSR